jgi:hypothetical protein
MSKTASLIGSCFVLTAYSLLAAAAQGQETDWRRRLDRELPLLGHRNWIVIVDSAYPLQASPGIETIATGGEHLRVLKQVLAALDQSKHVRPVIHLDAELPFVPEEDAPGIDAYRQSLGSLLKDQKTHSLPHEQIIERLDQSARTFRVLVIKTNLRLPYTSVFIELDCGYWSPEAEKRLRDAMKRPAANGSNAGTKEGASAPATN